MAAPIALRFRDADPEVDTIEEHRAIIEDFGSVLWGWWKKDSEHTPDRLAAIDFPRPLELLLINRYAKRSFVARCVEVKSALNKQDLGRIPGYYRSQYKHIPIWFRLTHLEEIGYEQAIGERFHDRTFLFLDEDEELDVETKAISINAGGKSTVLLLSDLHFGADYGFYYRGQKAGIGEQALTLSEALYEDLARIGFEDDVGAVLITGDFITKGDWNDTVRAYLLQEFEDLRDRLELNPEQVIAVPGNHDIERYSNAENIDPVDIAVENQTTYKHEREFRTFTEELINRSWRDPLNYVQRVVLAEVDLLVCILNSCRIAATEWTEYGFVGDTGPQTIRNLSNEPVNRPTFKMIALHHHLLPVSGVEVPQSKGVSLTLDAVQLLEEAQRARVHFAVHGHQHQPKLVRYQNLPLNGEASGIPLYVVANGSAGAKYDRLPGSERNTYALLQLCAGGAHLKIRELRTDGKVAAELFDGDLEIVPLET